MHNKILLFRVFVIVSLCIGSSVQAQKTAIYNDADYNFKKAVELFEKQKYGFSQEAFDEYQRSLPTKDNLMRSDADYYSALSAMELFNKDAEPRIINFINNNPESSRQKGAFFYVGKFQYREKRFKTALEWFEKIDPYYLNDEEKAEYYFKSGYSYFVVKDYDKSEKALYEIKDLNTKYTTPATYFYSHIAYTNKKYETALAGFQKLSKDELFGSIVPYYITQIYYLQEQFDSVITYSPGLLDSATTKRAPEIARIIGESYYRTNRFKEAIPYLELYRDKVSNITRRDIYELGYAYYRNGENSKAIATLDKITGVKDSLSQNSLYLLADCYLTENNKNMARIALGNASKMDFDPYIKEDAMFNYAKLTFELSYSPFNEAVSTFNEFVKTFPESKRLDEVYSMLGKVYMNTKNYKEAIEVFENIQNVTNEIEESYQRVAYFRGLELFNNLEFSQAIIHFDKSLNNAKYNQLYKAQSIFWKGESYYRLNRYDDAISQFNKFLLSTGAFGSKEFNLSYYSMGYCYFKKLDYKQALTWFRKFADNQPGIKTKHTADAYCRIGDCNFSARQYDVAVENYTKSIDIHLAAVDYAMFQKGFCLGLLKQYNDKIIVLNQLLSDYSGSPYVDDAMYELANSYVAIEEKEMALNTYQKIIDDYPASDFVRKSYIQMGLVYYNSDQNDKALTVYKKVIENYSNSPEAKDAFTGLKTVYLDMNDVNNYYAYLKDRGNQGDFRITEQDSLMYATAEKVYMADDCAKAEGLFADYITKFGDNGIFSVNVFYYKAECLNKSSNIDGAAENYKKVLSRPNSVFTEPALAKVSKYEFNKANYRDALSYYLTLESSAAYQTNITASKIGKMRCYFLLADLDNAKKSAIQVLAMEKLPDEIVREAHYTVGKCEYAINNYEAALEEFTLISKSCKSAIEAEAKYLTAEIYLKQNQNDLAENEVFDFVKKNTPQQKWLAKSFLLLADIYLAKKDNFQAKATLQSVIDNYTVKDDGMVDDAKSKLDQIKISEEQELLKKQLEQAPAPENIEININEETKTN
ncbi:MAG: tetratricopeptide repeat protein [Bacteroidia bacterium]|nr:tetratricopeptide repeat protein [Bacteroidia bacterium]